MGYDDSEILDSVSHGLLFPSGALCELNVLLCCVSLRSSIINGGINWDLPWIPFLGISFNISMRK